MELDIEVIPENEKGGKKSDTGKARADLLVPEALLAVARVLTHGAEKYGDNNWKLVERQRYEAALMRHLLSYMSDDYYDEDTKENHLAHIMTNAMFLFWFDEVNQDDD